MQEITVRELLSRMFTQIAVSFYPVEVWFPLDDNQLHPLIKELAENYGEVFPSLKNLHFQKSGAYPYSPELKDIIWILLESRKLLKVMRDGKTFFVPTYCQDSVSVLQEWKKTIFAENSETRNQFELLVMDFLLDYKDQNFVFFFSD